MTEIPVPHDAAAGIRDRTCLIHQKITIEPSWWAAKLAQYNAPGGPLQHTDRHLTRANVWTHTRGAANDELVAARLLWHALAWGTGTRPRHCRRRIRSVAADPAATLATLQRAAALAATDPEAAYAQLHPHRHRSRIRGLGPAFGTKFLYFAGGGNPDHPCLILDARVATALRRRGWKTIPNGGWGPDTYARYCNLAANWATELTTTAQTTTPTRSSTGYSTRTEVRRSYHRPLDRSDRKREHVRKSTRPPPGGFADLPR
ncbi:8-oxoguanine DNA glycosylase OGG fold protein [Phytohabitans rumicis]|uniref:8-oxoguanine DNA glycosylase OGG fold protein n=1 Tax=Phytohabitans rumicis TaxID=1076125 RepID=UPI0015670217|nr:hypothetical protein [Phytohabitans rumicis]